MSDIVLFLGAGQQLFDNNGDPLAGGKLYFYEPGTTDPKDTFNSSDLSVPNTNPVVLDGNGRAVIYLSGNYKVVVHNAADVLIDTQDNINPVSASASGNYNFVTNGSFEDNTLGDNKTPDGWNLTEESGSTVILDTTDQQHGDQSIKFTSTGNGGGNIISSNFFEVNPNREIDISYMIKSTAVDVRNVVEILWYDENQSSLSSTTLLDDSATNPTSWTLKQHLATPPSGARFAKVRMYGCHPSDATTGSTWFDDLVIREDTLNAPQIEHATDPDNDLIPFYDDSDGVSKRGKISNVTTPRGFISGLTLTNNATDSEHDIDIAAGLCRDADDTTSLRLNSSLTKQIDANWTEGDDAGGFPSGLTLAADTWYRVFVILKNDGTVDAGFDTAANASNLISDATDYTEYRQVGWVFTDGSSNVIQFFQTEFTGGSVETVWDDPSTDFSLDYSGGGGATFTASVPPIQCIAVGRAGVTRSTSSSEAAFYPNGITENGGSISSTPLGDAGGSIGGATSIDFVGAVRILTSSSGQLYAHNSSGTARWQTLGYVDPRTL